MKISIRSFRLKVAIAMIAGFFLFSALSDFLIYQYAVRAQFDQLRSKLMTIAETLSLMIEPDTVLAIPLAPDGVNTPQYKLLSDKLAKITKVSPAIAYIYIFRKGEKPGALKFVIDVKTDSQFGGDKGALPGEDYDASPFPELLASFNEASADKELTPDKWGVFLSGYAPIKDVSGNTAAVIGVDLEASDIQRVHEGIKKRIALLLALGLFFALLLGVLISRGVTGPIKVLIDGTRHVAEGDLRYKVNVKGDDEIAELGAFFNRMSRELERHMEELKRTTAEKERFLKELEIAKGIQQSFLPESCPRIPRFDIAAASLPAREVGGDFYDFIPLDKDRWGIAIADVSGKGMPAALFMALSRTLLRASATARASTVEVVKTANAHIFEDSKRNMFVTLFYAVLDASRMNFEYVNAGHNPPLLFRESESGIILLKADGVPLGILNDIDISSASVELKKGDVIVFYTDGVTDARNSKKEQFEIERLSEAISKNLELPAQEMLDKTVEAINLFVGGQPQFDDITLMVLKVN